MTTRQRIYLDNAATSWPKPETVYQAVDRYHRENGAPAGRSVYDEAQEVERQIQETRTLAARLLGDIAPSSVVFTCNGTDSLNLAIQGLLSAGDHVVTTKLEHNSVLRPLRHLQSNSGVDVTRVDCGPETVMDPEAIWQAIRPETKLLAITHMSNVTGARQPVEGLCQRALEHGILCLVDAAQSAGHEPLPFASLPNVLVAAPTHKGLLGPLGLGLLTVPPELAEQLQPLRQGGTGTRSEQDEQPASLPDRFESGNHNVPAILGLRAALKWIEQQNRASLHARLDEITQRLADGLEAIDGVTVFRPPPSRHGPVVAFLIDGFEPQEVAGMLDSGAGVQARAGFLCAPLIHPLLGAEQGVVRFSPGVFTTDDEVQASLDAVAEIADAAF